MRLARYIVGTGSNAAPVRMINMCDKHIGVRMCGGETLPGYCYWSTKVHADSMCGKPKGEAYNPPCHVI